MAENSFLETSKWVSAETVYKTATQSYCSPAEVTITLWLLS